MQNSKVVQLFIKTEKNVVAAEGSTKSKRKLEVKEVLIL